MAFVQMASRIHSTHPAGARNQEHPSGEHRNWQHPSGLCSVERTPYAGEGGGGGGLLAFFKMAVACF